MINLLIKGIHKRKRPPGNTYWSAIPFDQYSFPSGHAAGTMSVAMCLGIITLPSLLVPLIVWSVLIGAARFFDGSHHPSDIIGGFAIGILAASGLIAGEALIGLLWSGMQFLPAGSIPDFHSESYALGLLVLLGMSLLLIRMPLTNAGSPDEPAPPQALM